MSRPSVLDLFCGAGCAAMGYYRSGFDVVGVDINPQPNYPFEFHQADALEYPLDGFDLIHASPPCQQFTVYGNVRKNLADKFPNLIPETRDRLLASGGPYVIENVPRAPLIDPIRLCGTSFGIPVRRHRMFESNVAMSPPPCDHGRFTERRFPGSTNRPNGRTVCNVGEYRVPLKVQKECMQVDWDVTLHELSEGIPPVMTEWIGQQVLPIILRAAA